MAKLTARKRLLLGLRGGFCFLVIAPPIAGVLFVAIICLANVVKYGDVSSGMLVMPLFAIVGAYVLGSLPAFATGFFSSCLYQPPGSMLIYLTVCVVTSCAIGGLMQPWVAAGEWNTWLGLSLLSVPASLGAGATWWLYETSRL